MDLENLAGDPLDNVELPPLVAETKGDHHGQRPNQSRPSFDPLPSFPEVVGRPFSEPTSSLVKGSEIFGPGDLEPLDLGILTEGSIVIAVICHVNAVAAQIQIARALSPGNRSKDTIEDCLKGIQDRFLGWQVYDVSRQRAGCITNQEPMMFG